MQNHVLRSKQFFISLFTILWFCAFGFVSALFAQSPKVTGKGVISGLVADKRTQKPLQSVTVAVFRMQDTAANAKPVSGALTDEEGIFEITNLSYGCYRLRIRAFGFATTTVASLCLTAKESELVIEEEIFLETESVAASKSKTSSDTTAYSMKEISVVAEKQRKVVEADKTIFNIDQTLLAKGGNAQDVLKTLPSVSVNMEGTVNYRGSDDVQVLINGRMSMLSLDQIPAGNIDRIELVSNPSARFDAEGSGGIINIILKKDREQGFNATAQATAATGDKYNVSLEMGLQQTGIAAYLAAGYDAENFWNNGRNTLNTTNTAPQQAVSQIFQQENGVERSRNLWLYGGTILNPDDKTTIGPWIYAGRDQNTRTNRMDYRLRENVASIPTVSLQERTNTSIVSNTALEGGLWAERTFSSPKHKITLDAYITRNQALTTLDAEQRELDMMQNTTPTMLVMPRSSDFQRTRLSSLQTAFIGQLDYAQPFSDIGGGMLLETGVKISTRQIDNPFTAENATGQAAMPPTDNSLWEIDRSISNHFIFQERVVAAYATVAGTFGANSDKSTDKSTSKNTGSNNAWSYSAGIRAEGTAFVSDQRTSGENIARTFWNIFPSASIKYAFSEQASATLGFSRRISRPSAEQLNPFPQLLDPFNLRAGNPFLLPEYTNSLEAAYNLVFEKGSVNTSVYTKHTENLVGEFRRLLQNGGSLSTQENLGIAQLSGIEASGEVEPVEWLTLTASVNGFFKRIETRLNAQLPSTPSTQTLVNSGFGGSLRTTARVLFGSTEGEIAYSGTFAEPIAQGWMLPYYGWDIALKQKLFEDRLTLTMRLVDAFDTRQFGTVITTPTFSQESITKRESRIAYISISYKFGSGNDVNVREEQSARHGR